MLCRHVSRLLQILRGAAYQKFFFLLETPTRCFTPDEHQGTCIPFPSCTHLYNLVQKYPTNPRNRLYVSLSQCGLIDNQPYVCCKESADSLPPTTFEQFKITNKQIPKPGECGTFYEYRLISKNVVSYEFFW